MIRACEPTDADALADIMAQPGVRRGTLRVSYRSPESFRTWMEKLPAGTINLVAELAGRVVGTAHMVVAPPRRAHSAGVGLCVHDAYQGHGIGTVLFAALVECADLSLGLRRLELTVFSDNATAIALYRRFGFVEEGRSRGYAMCDGVLADVVHMARLADAPSFAQH